MEDVKYTVGKGWYGILDDLINNIEETNIPIDIHQIKEKFGTLRFYFGIKEDAILPNKNEAWKVVRNLVQKAESLSAGTCEYCGSRDGVTREGIPNKDYSWIKTLCLNCKYARERNEGG